MAAYLVVDTDLIDPDLYEHYKVQAKPLVEKFGGEYLARGGALQVKENQLWAPKRLVLISFPTVEHAEKFYDSTEYQAILPISKDSAKRTMVIIEGV